MKIFIQILFVFCSICSKSQIPDSILYNWKSNENSYNSLPLKFINAVNSGIDNTGKTDNSKLLQSIIDSEKTDSQTVIIFDSGIYKFSKTIFLKSYITIEGKGANKTKFVFENGGIGHLFDISSGQKNQFCKLYKDIKAKTDNFYSDSSVFENESYFEILIDGVGLATSDWAMQSIGQIVKVKSTENKMVIIYGDFKHDFCVNKNLRFRKINMVCNVNFKFFSIERKDKTSTQTNNFNFHYATNCSVQGVESICSNMSHIAFSKSYNCSVSDCYIHHAFGYGGGGKAYGTELSNTTSSCRIENNIFENLRHSILLQSGANGNVITGNFSKNPYWDEGLLPQNSAGEIVLHGNYPFANLIEQNQVGNIVVDNSHGINGPDNIFFRNRASLWGVFMNSGCGNRTHFIGNEITGNLLNFSGLNNFILSNFRTISDTANYSKTKLPQSFYYYSKPEWWPQLIEFPLLGIPKSIITKNIPSFYRYKFDSLRALNSANDEFLLNLTFSKKANKNNLIYTFESSLQVNVNSLHLEKFNSKANSWIDISENISNKFLFQNYKYTDSVKVNMQSCYRWTALGYKGKIMQSDTFCITPKENNTAAISEEKIEIFPNPFCEKIEIKSETILIAKIINPEGKTILTKQISPQAITQISTSHLSKGIYFLILETDGKSLIRKIVKD